MNFLSNTGQGMFSYAAKATLLSFVSAFLAGTIVVSLFAVDSPPEIVTESLFDIFGAVIFGPTVETLLMIPVFKAISYITKRTDATVILSALIWAALHSAFWIPWGIFVFLPFCVFSYAFINWQRVSPKSAVITVTMIHAMHNLTAVTISHLSDRFFT